VRSPVTIQRCRYWPLGLRPVQAGEPTSTSPTNGIREHSFGTGIPFTVGAEEELFLVDPLTGHAANSSRAVIGRIDPDLSGVERELHASMIELVSGVCSRASEVVEQLAERRAAVIATGAGLLGSGTHPTGTEDQAEISDKERYEQISHLLGDAVATPVAGLHVHIGMPDAPTAIRVFNGLRADLPLLHALAANSPFRHGRDTGLASAREITSRSWPRSGVPRALASFDDFGAMTSVLARAADVPDYTWFWWKLRPHPRLGTVEIRALDAQSALTDVGALVALARALARAAADEHSSADIPSELVEEGLFRAARFGVDAELPDGDGYLHPVSEVLERALVRVAPYTAELGCDDELACLPAMVARGGGAGRQREVYEIAGIEALLRRLTEITSSGDEASC
jgi:glutamate---cysteine ligase / carboxylate-amine ligase